MRDGLVTRFVVRGERNPIRPRFALVRRTSADARTYAARGVRVLPLDDPDVISRPRNRAVILAAQGPGWELAQERKEFATQALIVARAGQLGSR